MFKEGGYWARWEGGGIYMVKSASAMCGSSYHPITRLTNPSHLPSSTNTHPHTHTHTHTSSTPPHHPAIHSVVFGGFSAEALADRLVDCDSRLVLTADEGLRGGKKVPLKHTVDTAMDISGHDCKVLVVEHTKGDVR